MTSMGLRAWLPVIAVTALGVVPEASGVDPARSFLMDAFSLSAADIGRLDGGHVVTRTLDASNRREVATFGVVRIKATPAAYVERLGDIASFKRTADVVQIGTFSNPAQAEDLAPLTVEEADLKGLRDCRVEECGIRLSAADIDRARQTIDWQAADASPKAAQFVRQLLVDYVGRYQQDGSGAAMEYADRSPRLHVGREFTSLIEGDAVTGRYATGLYRHLQSYPAATADRTTDFVYWSKEKVRGRPVISITHVAIAPADDAAVAFAIGSKQIYAMHYFDASLGLTLLVPDRTSPTPATYVVYVNRSRIDLFDGLFGGVARRIVAGKARSFVAVQLERLQGMVVGTSTQGVAPEISRR